MLSRRTFLAGAGAITAAGAVGTLVVGPDKVLRTLGLRNSPDHRVPPSGWPVVEHTLPSRAMGGDVRWAISVPDGADATGVVICLHGRNGNRRRAFDSVHLHDVVASLGASVAIVGVDGGAHSYYHPRRDGTDALAMILDELLPAVDTELGGGLPRAVLGWSMGGYGALLVAEQAPDRFRAVAAASPALWQKPGESSPGAFDGPEDFETYNVFTGSPELVDLAVRVDCGTSDGFVHRARLFAAQLPNPNLGSFGPGYHDAAYWRSIAPDQIATITDAFAA